MRAFQRIVFRRFRLDTRADKGHAPSSTIRHFVDDLPSTLLRLHAASSSTNRAGISTNHLFNIASPIDSFDQEKRRFHIPISQPVIFNKLRPDIPDSAAKHSIKSFAMI
ncbi:hypothetical protein [Burkholderia stagnalis]|uniref:hypothetical protein n=1 Tax=Burkholderia stagnalis TaxID=1503054 RepID=UPI000F58AC2F|nr:hypothetical protein [Burkholderia stagnalis]